MIRESKYPESLFVGSEATLSALRARIGASLGERRTRLQASQSRD